MFSSEKELVEKLVLDLQERYNTQYIVRELIISMPITILTESIARKKFLLMR